MRSSVLVQFALKRMELRISKTSDFYVQQINLQSSGNEIK